MRILHTADWHLGKTLERRDRRAEQEAFVEEICEICGDEKIHMVLIAGDVFQNANPGAAAEQLFYHALDRLAGGGTRAVVAIAGNHDNPDRLCAAHPLAERQGITLIGYPGLPLTPDGPGDPRKVRRVAAGASRLEIVVPGCDHAAVIAALPYPSEGRLRELVSESLEEEDMLRAYNRKIAALFAQLAASYRRDTVNLAMTHLYVQGGIETGTESQIQTIGGSYAIDPAVFPAGAQYVALGHLHRPQNAGGAAPARYAGSPLAHSFSEANHVKSVTLVEVEPGKRAAIKEIPLKAGKPLVTWKAGSADEVIRGLEEGRYANAWIDLEIRPAGAVDVDPGLIRRIRGLAENIVNIRIVGVGSGEELGATGRAELESLPLNELFTLFYKRQTGGLEPDEALVRLFMELAEERGTAEEPGEEAV